jgi:hypothetical protein
VYTIWPLFPAAPRRRRRTRARDNNLTERSERARVPVPRLRYATVYSCTGCSHVYCTGRLPCAAKYYNWRKLKVGTGKRMGPFPVVPRENCQRTSGTLNQRQNKHGATCMGAARTQWKPCQQHHQVRCAKMNSCHCNTVRERRVAVQPYRRLDKAT